MKRLIPGVLCFLLLGSYSSADDEPIWNRFKSAFLQIDGKFVELSRLDFAKAEQNQLADIKQGDAGYYLAVQVVSVRGDGDMVVRRVFKVLSGPLGRATFVTKFGPPVRLKGFPTKDLIEEQVWKGPDSKGVSFVVIGSSEAPAINGGTQRLFQAVSLDLAKKGLTREQFAQLLAEPERRAKLEKDFRDELELEARVKKDAAQLEALLKLEAEQKAKEKAEADAKAQVAAKNKAEEQYQGAALAKFKLAKTYLDNGNKVLAKKKLEEIVKEYPRATIIEEARMLLKKLE